MLSNNRYQVLVSDVKMPEMNGFELLKFAKGKDPKMAVVMMTAFGDDFTVKEAMMLGADEYVIKPFKSADIVSAVERAWWRSLAGPAKPAPRKNP
jgi:DNA-binding NtrC family response regulator